jgi:hypothetical protein
MGRSHKRSKAKQKAWLERKKQQEGDAAKSGEAKPEYQGRRGSRSRDKLRKHNALMEEYYGVASPNALVTDPAEHNVIFECMRTELPAAFRINAVGSFAQRLRDTLAGEVSKFHPSVLR